MKTNVILQSESRELLGIIIRQKTENGFLCLTDLQYAFDKARIEYGWNDRRINDIISTQTFKERIYYILKELKIIETEFTAFMEMLDYQGIVESFKKLQIWEMKGKGSERLVWVNPYIFVGIALEINPKLYAATVIWLTDSLIFDRKEAGGNYLPMNIAIDKKLGLSEYWKYAILINEKIFGKHEKGIRNLASKEDLKKITKLEEIITMLINMEYVKSEYDLINAINKI
jgi:hypothetical protein